MNQAPALLLVLTLTLLLSACSGAPPVSEPAQAFSGRGSIPVYFTNYGWHTGVLLPAASLRSALPELSERFADAEYLDFGWGDRDFYQTDEMTSGLALQAVLWPTATVMRVASYSEALPRELRGAGVVKLCATEAELASLVDFIARSFERDDEGEVIAVGDARPRRQFYTGAGRYHISNTCNVWTAKALRSLGVEISPRFKLTAGSVMGFLHDYSQAQSLAEFEGEAQASPEQFSCPSR